MTQQRNTIRTFALVCVAITSIFVMLMGAWIVQILSGADWCARALGAGGLTGKDSTVKGLDGCVALLKIQLNSLAWNSHILLATLALCLLVLMVIVIAGGRLSFKASKTGIEADVARDAEQAADRVAGAAVTEAEAVKDEVKP